MKYYTLRFFDSGGTLLETLTSKTKLKPIDKANAIHLMKGMVADSVEVYESDKYGRVADRTVKTFVMDIK